MAEDEMRDEQMVDALRRANKLAERGDYEEAAYYTETAALILRSKIDLLTKDYQRLQAQIERFRGEC